MTRYPSQSHYSDSEQPGPCPILVMLVVRQGSDKYQLCKGLTRLGIAPMTSPTGSGHLAAIRSNQCISLCIPTHNGDTLSYKLTSIALLTHHHPDILSVVLFCEGVNLFCP